MRVCIIGNSHLAALKKAWDSPDLLAEKRFEATFFGSHRDSLRRVYVLDGKLVTCDPVVRRTLAMTSGIADPSLRIEDFDVFVLHALINPNWILPYTLRLMRHTSLHGVGISSGLVHEVVADIYGGSMLAHMVDIIRSTTAAPIVVSPQPYLSCKVIGDESYPHRYAGMERIAEYRGPSFVTAFDAVMAHAADKYSFSILPQPIETVVDGCFTAHQFCSGSVRLTADMEIKHPADDFAHMNEAYGALVLRDAAASFCGG